MTAFRKVWEIKDKQAAAQQVLKELTEFIQSPLTEAPFEVVLKWKSSTISASSERKKDLEAAELVARSINPSTPTSASSSDD